MVSPPVCHESKPLSPTSCVGSKTVKLALGLIWQSFQNMTSKLRLMLHFSIYFVLHYVQECCAFIPPSCQMSFTCPSLFKTSSSLIVYEYLCRIKHFKKENVFFVGIALVTAGPLRQSQSKFVLYQNQKTEDAYNNKTVNVFWSSCQLFLLFIFLNSFTSEQTSYFCFFTSSRYAKYLTLHEYFTVNVTLPHFLQLI